MRVMKQEFIYGFKLAKDGEVDVKRIAQKYKMDYVCAGMYGDGQGVVIGVKIPLQSIIGDESMGKGRIHKFSVERFLTTYQETREKLNGERANAMKKELQIWREKDVIPQLYAVSHAE